MGRIARAATFMAVVLAASPSPIAAQSLAAIALQTPPASRSTTRTYGNEDLVDADAPSPEAATVPATKEAVVEPPATPPGRHVVEEDMGAGSVNFIIKPETNASAQNEPYWRRVLRSVRDRIARAEADLSSAEVLRQTATGPNYDRLTILHSRARHDLELLSAELGGHLNRAKALGVPAAWLR